MLKKRVAKLEAQKGIRKQDCILLAFTDEEKGTMEIEKEHQRVFSGPIDEGKKFINNMGCHAVILPGGDPRWCH